MDYRALRIIVWLVFVALLAIFVVGASASPAPRQDEQDSFRIATTWRQRRHDSRHHSRNRKISQHVV
jgi:hypothetical protein